MKIVLVLGMLFAISQATSDHMSYQEQAVSAVKDCIKKKDADETQIKQFFARDILPEDDADFSDFFFCYWQKLGIFDDDGVLNELQLKALMPKAIKTVFPTIENVDELAENTVNNCNDVTGISNGQRAIKYRNCMMKYVKDNQE